MLERGLTTVAVRIAGILMLIETISTTTRSVLVDLHSPDRPFEPIAYLPIAVIVISAILFITTPSKFSTLIFRENVPEKQRMALE